MAYDEKLAKRVTKILNNLTDLEEKAMFGGICYIHRGNMACAVTRNRLMLRVGREKYAWALKQKNAKEMDFTGQPMKGFIFVNSEALKSDKELKKWIKLAFQFTNTLPIKIGPPKNSILRKTPKKNAQLGVTPLKNVKNFGPVTLAEYDSMGITTLEQIQKIGFEEMCRKYVMYYPERLNANAFLGIICSIENTVWTKAAPHQRNEANTMARMLRKELGITLKTLSRRRRK